MRALQLRTRVGYLALYLPATLGGVDLARPAAQSAELDPTALIDSGWSLLPSYDGSHRDSLTTDEHRNTTAAAHLFGAAVALDPENLLGWWRRAHACTLLAEDARTRGRLRDAEREHEQAREALDRAVALDPDDPWSRYSRGVLAAREDAEHAVAELDL